jgi:hypothetical protein
LPVVEEYGITAELFAKLLLNAMLAMMNNEKLAKNFLLFRHFVNLIKLVFITTILHHHRKPEVCHFVKI